MNDKSIEQLARLVIAAAWIFPGLVPKLIYIAPAEWYLSSQFGFSESMTYWVITAAGLAEICFGVLFFLLYRNKWINYANVAGLVGLIVMVAFLDWRYLFGAFNPITTNVPLVVLSLLLLSKHHKR